VVEWPRSEARIRSKVRFLLHHAWLKLNVDCSLPVPLLNTPPAEQRFIHRLTYNTLPAATPKTGASHTPTALKFEIKLGLSDTNSASAGDTTHGFELSQPKPSINKTVDLAPICSVGPEAHLNLMIPDRFVHSRHSVS
jgi:hypothetical protein